MTQIIASLSSDGGSGLLEEIATPQLKAMVNMLPPGYDISKIPEEVLKAVAEGKMPHVSTLPVELQQYILNGGNQEQSTDSAKKVECYGVIIFACLFVFFRNFKNRRHSRHIFSVLHGCWLI